MSNISRAPPFNNFGFKSYQLQKNIAQYLKTFKCKILQIFLFSLADFIKILREVFIVLQYLRTLVEKETSLGLVLNGVGRTVENMDLGIFRLQSLSILIIRIKYFCSQSKVINPPPLFL